jgi:drug/metabolite transporter (DMT)-like permease
MTLKQSTPQNFKRRTPFALWVLIATQLITSATYLVAKLGLREFTPFAFGCFRFTFAGLVYLAILKARGKFRLPERRDWPAFFWLAFVCVPLNQGLFLYGIHFTFASHGALFYATTPIMVLILSSLWLRERPTFLKITGVLLGFLGVLLVLFDKGIHLSPDTLRGDLLLLAAVFTWALYTIQAKKLLRRYSTLEVTAYALILGSVLFLPVGVPGAIRQDYSLITRTGVASLVFLAIMTSVVAYLVWSWALSKLEASKVAVISNLQPILSALLSWMILGEAITLRFVAGAAVVLAGVFLTEKG